MSDRVTTTISDGVADVRLSRPEKMNAIDTAMFRGLIEAGEQLALEKGVRAVVLSGEGRAFCAGLDFSSFANMADGKRPLGQNRSKGADNPSRLLTPAANSPANFAQRAGWVWRELPVPVVAALHGVAYGGGLQIALAADIRIAAPDARLSVMEIKWGLIPDMSGSQTLRHLVRDDVARELTFTGRVVSGEEASAIGLVTCLSETPYENAMAMARGIAGRSPDAIRAAKRLMNATRLSTLEDGLQLEAALQASLIGGENQIEAVKANMEKRPAKFRDPD